MRLIIFSCLIFLATNCNSKKSDSEKEKTNVSTGTNDAAADQKKAEDNVKLYATQRSKGKPVDFVFGKLEKSTENYQNEVFILKCSFKETYDDGGNPMNMNDTYFLDKDLNVVRVQNN